MSSDQSSSGGPDPGFAARGLSAGEVRQRVERGQVNDVPARSSRSTGQIVRANVFTRFNLLIGTMFVLILAVGEYQDALFGLVIIANTGIGIIQEWRAKRTLDRLALLGQATARVRRDGQERELAPAGIVLDDAVLLGPGEKVLVDGVVLAAAGLEVDESLLTGEADPVVKRPGDRVLSGSFAVAGDGTYQATRVGREAYAAALAEQAGRFTLVRSDLRSGIDRFLRIITWLIVPTAALLAISQFANNESWRDAVTGTVAGVVTMVPEGLVLLTSVAFAVGVVRLGRRNCLVQELPAIEGLARVDVVCVDKTGTLTEPGMRLADVRPLGGAGDDVGMALAALAGTDPTPNASVAAIAARYPDPPGWTPTEVAAFSSARKWSGASFDGHGTWVLGAPEVLLPAGDEALRQADDLAGQGLRVLVLARAGGPLSGVDVPGRLSPAALVVLEQKIRPDAAATVRYFAEQGVAVKVISGDSARTVGAVAQRLDIPGAGDPVDARTLSSGDPTELAPVLDDRTVFGRVTPHQKQAMVHALHARGHTVAMTGDGVNDVLALKDADIGVAMGSGSDASRAVAQIVLLDDRFAVLPGVVAEGRRVIGNIERVARLFLTKTVYSTALAAAVGVARLPFPFLPRHLTLVASLTIGMPAFFLALAPNTERARTGMVPRVLRFAVPAGLIAAAASFLSYYLARRGSTSLEVDRTMATITLMIAGLGVLVVTARPFTWWKYLLVAAMTGGFLLTLAVPFARRFFALHLDGVPQTLGAVGVGLLAAAAVLLVGPEGLRRPLWGRDRLPEDARPE